ncbi:MAG: LD-carboxypeptidase [Acidobacteriota bacterium]
MTALPRPLPPPLVPGDKIGVWVLAGGPAEAALQRGVELLQEAGFEVLVRPAPPYSRAYLAAPDEARLAALGELLDAGVRALVAARGGYGVMRLLERLPWERLAAWGGWVVGFSDVTALHAALAARFPFATLHGPMVASLGRDTESTSRLLALLRGEDREGEMTFRPLQVVRSGVARGVAVGGNLSLLCALAGTPFEPEYGGAIVFIEEVAEPLFRLDRMLTHLRLSSRLAAAKAVIAGELVRCGRGETGWRERWRELLAEVAPPGAPVVEGLPFGHGKRNRPFPLGVEVEVDTARGTVSWGGR